MYVTLPPFARREETSTLEPIGLMDAIESGLKLGLSSLAVQRSAWLCRTEKEYKSLEGIELGTTLQLSATWQPERVITVGNSREPKDRSERGTYSHFQCRKTGEIETV